MAKTKAVRPKKRTGRGMEWIKVGKGRFYELRRAGRLLGTLEWAGGRRTLCEFAARGKVWTFKRTGFFRPIVTIRAHGRDADVATFTPGVWWPNPALTFADGRKYFFAAGGVWRAEYTFKDAKGRLAVRLTRKGLTGKTIEAAFGPGTRNAEEGLLLCALDLYLVQSAAAECGGDGGASTMLIMAGV